MYLQNVWIWPRITGTEPWNCAVAGERLVSARRTHFTLAIISVNIQLRI